MTPKNRILNAGQRKFLKETGVFIMDILYNALIIITLVILIRTFLISPFRVIGSSMADTLHNSEFILINKLSYRLSDPHRGDPIVFRPPITNKYSEKFDLTVTTDASGLGTVDIRHLQTQKTTDTCQYQILKAFWFCKDEVAVDDLIYFRPADDFTPFNESTWRTAQKQIATDQDLSKGLITIQAQPNTKYTVKIYDHAGPEFFVKRIIGIPGDTIKIENGRVYLKKSGDTDFTEIQEPYLNSENHNQTYFPQRMASSEVIVPEGHYFALGDNRNHSNDSRSWFSPIDQSYTPFISKYDINGKVLIVLWPLPDLRLIPSADL